VYPGRSVGADELPSSRKVHNLLVHCTTLDKDQDTLIEQSNKQNKSAVFCCIVFKAFLEAISPALACSYTKTQYRSSFFLKELPTKFLPDLYL